MIKFGLSFETSVRPGLLRFKNQFSCSPHPIMAKRTFRVSAFSEDGDGVHFSSSTYRTHEPKPGEAGRSIVGLQEGIVMGAANA